MPSAGNAAEIRLIVLWSVPINVVIGGQAWALAIRVRSAPKADMRQRTRWAKRFTSHCKKHSNLSRRQTTMKSATAPLWANRRHEADPESSKSGNGNLQHLREMTLRSA
jgi:hypothetical protein